jgi:hypothetical protein
MGKRIIIKTTLICTGIFLMLNSVILTCIFKKYPLDLEQNVPVVTAVSDIEPGTVIERRHVRVKLIKESSVSNSMLTNIEDAVGQKAVTSVLKSDYLRLNDLVGKNNWYEDDDRIIILPVSIEERLANLIRKGSYIDIRLKRDISPEVQTILHKVKVEDMLDENGNSLESKTAINSKTAFMKLILNDNDRQKMYTSLTEGKLIYELYCDETQK